MNKHELHADFVYINALEQPKWTIRMSHQTNDAAHISQTIRYENKSKYTRYGNVENSDRHCSKSDASHQSLLFSPRDAEY